MTGDTGLHLMLVDDEQPILVMVGDYLRDSGHTVDCFEQAAAALEALKKTEYDLALVDVRMPGMDGLELLGRAREIRPDLPVVIITGHGNLETAVQAMRLGAADLLTKPVKFLELDATLEKANRLHQLWRDRDRLRRTIGSLQAKEITRSENTTLVGGSHALEVVRQQIDQALEAECDTILIMGETGTGKEVVARQIHFRSSPEESPFIAVSCPALPETLVESELFGHVKGTFTGATEDRPGCFELADGGTLFLDEVGDLSPAAQAKLLRVLETRAVRRLGGSRELEVKVRVIAATNRPLQQLAERDKFRRDLFFRLNVFVIQLLPLSQRREDILPLAEHFLRVYRQNRGQAVGGFSPESKKILESYDYPGNARELKNLVERSAMLCKDGDISPGHLNLSQAGQAVQASPGSSEAARILDALERNHWNRRRAAAELGISYSSLRRRIEKYDLG